ncbi:MAG: ABC-F family ATP-binding cassette domain-containing protein [Tenericutes bacterium]|nr:ABC-F family ATP-binding cassette domain-containing protein [Mycoplasmatota bacterium]
MNLLKINNLKKTFGGNVLFDNLSLEINPTDKVALIGRNGVGKSTLVKILLNEITPDSGEIFIYRQARIGYLSQDIIKSLENTMFEECASVFKELVDLEKRLHQLTKEMETDHSEAMLKRYTHSENEFQIKGGYEYLTTIDMLLTRFGFTKDDYDRQIKTFSGGERTRVAFAKLLMTKPDLLILDEPTNHMDIEIIEWLEEYLKRYSGAVLVITHDKYFINKVVNKIYEIDQERLETYYGNYDEYEVEKVKRYELLMKRFLKQKKQIAHLQSFVDRFRYNSKRASIAQDRVKKINRIKKIEKPTNSASHVKIAFKTKRPTDVYILEVEDLSIGYDKPLLEHINFKMRGYEKLGIIGGNGTGKTTLIKTIMGKIKALKGKCNFYKEMKIGYFDQNQMALDDSLTVMQTIHNIYPYKTIFEVRSDIAKVLFVGEDADKSVSILSGGEKVRLSILLLMLEEPELLILDEPTNHLDIDTKNIVEDVFEAYEGPIIFISHDRYFINKVATKIISIKGHLSVFDGNYTQYVEETKREIEIKKQASPKLNKQIVENPEKIIKKLEKEIDNLDMDLVKLKEDLFLEEVYMDRELYQEKSQKIKTIESQIEAHYGEIENLSD